MTVIQYKKLPPEYYEYNPKGKSYFRISECEDCGMLYIEEVGIARFDPECYVDDELYIHDNKSWFCVVASSKGLCRTLKGAQKKLNRMLRK